MIRRFVIDADVIFPALWNPDGAAGRLIAAAAEGRAEIHAPEEVREEIERNVRKKLDYKDPEIEQLFLALPIRWHDRASYAPALGLAGRAIRDATDAPVVALALALGAPIVSGDKDFHPLREPLVETLRPRAAMEEIGS